MEILTESMKVIPKVLKLGKLWDEVLEDKLELVLASELDIV